MVTTKGDEREEARPAPNENIVSATMDANFDSLNWHADVLSFVCLISFGCSTWLYSGGVVIAHLGGTQFDSIQPRRCAVRCRFLESHLEYAAHVNNTSRKRIKIIIFRRVLNSDMMDGGREERREWDRKQKETYAKQQQTTPTYVRPECDRWPASISLLWFLLPLSLMLPLRWVCVCVCRLGWRLSLSLSFTLFFGPIEWDGLLCKSINWRAQNEETINNTTSRYTTNKEECTTPAIEPRGGEVTDLSILLRRFSFSLGVNEFDYILRHTLWGNGTTTNPLTAACTS